MAENRLVYFVDDDPLANQLFQRVCKQIGYPCEVLDSVAGSQGQAAKILGINRTTLWRKIHPR